MAKCMRLVLFLMLLSIFAFPSCVSEPPPPLELRFLDVGQGDAALLRTPMGDVLIDAGTDDSEERLRIHLKLLGVETLRLAVFTHSDEDHIGGADGVLRDFPTEEVWISSYFEENECMSLLLDAASSAGSSVRRVSGGETFKIGDVQLSVLSPVGSMPNFTRNDKSIVLLLSCMDMNALFMGDAEEMTEQLLLSTYAPGILDCDVVKVGHHGASTACSDRFLTVTTPKYAVISCGEKNYYGHPHGETLQRLQKAGTEVLRTDLMGEIILSYDGEKLELID